MWWDMGTGQFLGTNIDAQSCMFCSHEHDMCETQGRFDVIFIGQPVYPGDRHAQHPWHTSTLLTCVNNVRHIFHLFAWGPVDHLLNSLCFSFFMRVFISHERHGFLLSSQKRWDFMATIKISLYEYRLKLAPGLLVVMVVMVVSPVACEIILLLGGLGRRRCWRDSVAAAPLLAGHIRISQWS